MLRLSVKRRITEPGLFSPTRNKLLKANIVMHHIVSKYMTKYVFIELIINISTQSGWSSFKINITKYSPIRRLTSPTYVAFITLSLIQVKAS